MIRLPPSIPPKEERNNKGMLGFDFDLLNLSAPDVIEKFRKDIEKEVGEPVTTFTLFHQSGTNEVVIKTTKHRKIIKGKMLSFLIRKGLKMKLKKNVDFKSIELVYAPEQSHLVMHTSNGIETQVL